MTAGVTFDALDEAEKMFDKWQIDPNNWEPPDDNWKNVIKQLFVLGSTGYVFGDLINKIKDFIQSLGAIEGDNLISEGYVVDDSGILGRTDFFSLPYTRIYNGNYVSLSRVGKVDDNFDLLRISSNIESLNNRELKYPTKKIYSVQINENHKGWVNLGIFSNGKIFIQVVCFTVDAGGDIDPAVNEGFELPDSYTITYNVKPDSIILSDRDPFEIPEWYQPNIIDIVPTIEITTPQGITETIYEGTEEELFEDLIDKITWEDLQSSQPREPYVLTEIQSGTKIETGESTTTPYPDIEVEPIEDTSQFQGENIGLLKSIINWLSNIRNEIVNIGDKIDNQFEEEIDEEEPKEIDFSPITSVSLTDKFPFSLPWDLKDSISLLASEGQAPVWEIPLVTETITIDMGEFEGIASIARVFNTLLFIITLIILTRRFI